MLRDNCRMQGVIGRSFLIFVGVMGANICNYFFQIAMGRFLSIEDFGILNSLIAVIALITTPFVAITNYIAKQVAYFEVLGKPDMVNKVISTTHRIALRSGAVLFLLGVVAAPWINENLKIGAHYPVIVTAAIVFISIMIPVNTGVLQGLHRFGYLSAIPAGLSILRLLFGAVLAALGFGVSGVLGGTAISILLIYWITWRPIRDRLRNDGKSSAPTLNRKEMVKIVGPILLANIAFVIFTQFDVVLVKYYFSPTDAGLYSSAAVIGKIVMYLPYAIVLAMFPMVVANSAVNTGSRHLLVRALGITFTMSGLGALILYLFPTKIVGLFFGAKFLPAADLIGLFALTMLPFALLMVVNNYLIACGRSRFASILIVFSMLEIVIVMHNHASIRAFLFTLMGIGVGSLVTILMAEAFRYRPLNEIVLNEK